MKLRFLHLSDVFLGGAHLYLGDRARERADDVKASFRGAVEYALQPANGIDAVLVPGNLFASHRPDEDVWNFAKGLLSRLLAKDIVVAVTPGHHDSLAYKHAVWRTERLPGVITFLDPRPQAPVVREIRGVRLHLSGLAYVPGQTPLPLPEFPRAEGKAVRVVLLNGVRDAARPDGDALVERLPLDVDALAAQGFDYVACGGEPRYREDQIGRTTIVHPGGLEGRSFDRAETGEKGFVLVEIDDDGVHVERRIVNRKTIETVALDLHAERITDAAGLENAIRTLGGDDRIVEVTLTGTAEFLADLDEIADALQGSFHHLVIRDESRIVDSALLRKIESENTIRGYFVRKLAARMAELEAEIAKKGASPERLRTLRVHESALKIGVEQFLEEEAPADSIYSMIPASDERVAADDLRQKVGVAHLEQRVRAMLDYRRQKGGTAGGTNDVQALEGEEGRS